MLDSSIKKSSIIKTPFWGSIDLQSEAKTQSLLPIKLFPLPMTKLLQPMTVLLLPRTMLLYQMRQLLMVWRRVVTVMTCWYMVDKRVLLCRPELHLNCRSDAMKSPLKPFRFWNGKSRMMGKGGLRQLSKVATCDGPQLKLRQSESFRVIIAIFVCYSNVRSRLSPAKQF